MVKFNRSFDDETPVYDENEDERETEGSSLLLAVTISLLLLLALGGVVWLAYNSGVAHGQQEALKTATATKSLPADSTVGSAVDAENSDKAAEVPPPAAPEQTAPPPPQNESPSPNAAASKPLEAPKSAVTPKTAEKPVEAKAAVAPTKDGATKTVATPKATPVQTSKPAPKAAETRVPVKPAAKADAKVTAKADGKVSAKPVANAPANLLPAAAVKTPAKEQGPVSASTSASAGGGAVLQIGAYKSEADAMAAWKTYKSKQGALVSALGPSVQKVDLGDKGVWYRLRIGPFAGKDTATALCDKLKANGGACIPTK